MQFQLKKTYSFRTLAPNILGDSYSGMKVLAIMTGEQATMHEDVATTHGVIKAYISGLPSSVNSCTFILFEKHDGTKKVFAVEYIDPYSISEVTITNARIDVMNVTSTEIAIIRSRLMELGHTNLTITPYVE